MLIKPFANLFKEQIDPTTMSYLGYVEDNQDPEKLGRVRVRVAPYSDLKTEDLPWASPQLGSCGNSASAGGLNIPEIGSQVRVTFPSRDFTAPYYSGAELNEVSKTTFFDDDYPNTYGYKDSIGNFVKVNKARGTVQFQHSSSTNLQIAPSGSIKVSLSNGAYFILDNGQNFELNVGALSVSGSADGSYTVDALNEINMSATQTNINSDVYIDGDLTVKTGASGTFLTLGNLVTVKDGIIVSIQ